MMLIRTLPSTTSALVPPELIPKLVLAAIHVVTAVTAVVGQMCTIK